MVIAFGDANGADGRVIEFIYDAGGRKLRKTVIKSGAITKQTDYVGGMEYQNSVPSRIMNSEGSIIRSPMGVSIRLTPSYLVQNSFIPLQYYKSTKKVKDGIRINKKRADDSSD
jgi:hypothetical protein